MTPKSLPTPASLTACRCTQASGDNIVVDLLSIPMPATGRSAYNGLPYNTGAQCGFYEMYAFQEWAQLQYSVRPAPPLSGNLLPAAALPCSHSCCMRCILRSS